MNGPLTNEEYQGAAAGGRVQSVISVFPSVSIFGNQHGVVDTGQSPLRLRYPGIPTSDRAGLLFVFHGELTIMVLFSKSKKGGQSIVCTYMRKMRAAGLWKPLEKLLSIQGPLCLLGAGLCGFVQLRDSPPPQSV